MCLAIPGKIISIASETDVTSRPGKVSFGGILKEVNLCFLPEASVGDYVLVHVGVALSVVDEELAHETLNYLQQMGELDELETESFFASSSEPEQGQNPGGRISQKGHGYDAESTAGTVAGTDNDNCLETEPNPVADPAASNGKSGLHPKSGGNR